jgi:predicted ATPase
MEFRQLRPYAELDEQTEKILHFAYAYTLEHEPSPISGEQLRYSCNVTQQSLRRLVELRLLTDDQPDSYRLSLIGLTYLPEAASDLHLVDAMVRLAHDRYRPQGEALSAEEIRQAIPEATLDALARVAPLLSSAGVSLLGAHEPKKRQFSLRPSEQNRGNKSLSEVLAAYLETLPSRRSTEDLLEAAPFQLKIGELRVSSFRALRDLHLPLGSLTVFVGPNGVGKSAVLDALAFLGEAAKAGLDTPLAREGGIARLRTRGETKPISLGVSFELNYGQGQSAKGSFDFSFDDLLGRTVVEREDLSIDTNPPTQIIHGRRGRALILKRNGEIDDRFHSPGGLALSELHSYDSHPLWQDVRSALSRIVLMDRDPLLGPSFRWPQWEGNSRGHRARAGAQLDKLLSRVVESRALTEKLGQLTAEFVPSIERIERRIVTAESPSPFLEIFEKGVGGPLSIDEISSGTRQMMLLAAAYLDPHPPSLLAIEEPEAGLHPTAMQPLVDLFRSLSTRMTVVVTTHSPSLVGLLDPEKEVLVLDRGREGIRAVRLAEALSSRAWLKAFGSREEAFIRYTSEKKT